MPCTGKACGDCCYSFSRRCTELEMSNHSPWPPNAQGSSYSHGQQYSVPPNNAHQASYPLPVNLGIAGQGYPSTMSAPQGRAPHTVPAPPLHASNSGSLPVGSYPSPVDSSIAGQGYPSFISAPPGTYTPGVQPLASLAIPKRRAVDTTKLPEKWRFIPAGEEAADPQAYIRHLEMSMRNSGLRYSDLLTKALKIRPAVRVGPPASEKTKLITAAEVTCNEKISVVRPWTQSEFDRCLQPRLQELKAVIPSRLSSKLALKLEFRNEDMQKQTKYEPAYGDLWETKEGGRSDSFARCELEFIIDVLEAFLQANGHLIDLTLDHQPTLNSHWKDRVLLAGNVIPDFLLGMALQVPQFGKRLIGYATSVERKTLAVGAGHLEHFPTSDMRFIWPDSTEMYKRDNEADERIIVQVATQMSVSGARGAILHTLGYQMYFIRVLYGHHWTLMRTDWRENSYLEQAAFFLHCIYERQPHLIEEHRRHLSQATLQSPLSQQTNFRFSARSELPSLALTNTLTSSHRHLGFSRVFSSFKKFLFPVWSNLDIYIGQLQQARVARFQPYISYVYALLRWLPALPLQTYVITNNIEEERSVLLCPELGMIFKIFPTREALLNEAAFITFASSKDISVPKVLGTFSGMLYLLAEEWAGETLSSLESLSPASISYLLSQLERCHANKLHHHDLALRNLTVRPDGTVCILDWGRACIIEQCHEHCPDVRFMEYLRVVLEYKDSQTVSGIDYPQGTPTDDDVPSIDTSNIKQPRGYSATCDNFDGTGAFPIFNSNDDA